MCVLTCVSVQARPRVTVSNLATLFTLNTHTQLTV